MADRSLGARKRAALAAWTKVRLAALDPSAPAPSAAQLALSESVLQSAALASELVAQLLRSEPERFTYERLVGERGRAPGELRTEALTQDQVRNLLFDWVLGQWALAGQLAPDTRADALYPDALAYVTRAADMQAARAGAATTKRTVRLPPRQEIIAFRWHERPFDPAQMPQLMGRVPRPGELRRVRERQYDLAHYWQRHERALAHYERALAEAEARSKRQQQRGIEVTAGPRGTVSAGPKRMSRGRKRGGRKKR